LPDEPAQHPTRPALSRDRIVRTALAIVDSDGLPALTMRRLGRDLGVTTMAVYHHFPNKSALYDGIVEAVMAEIDVSADKAGEPFGVRLRRAARAYRDVLVAHPRAMPVLISRGPRTPAALVPVETLIGIFRDAGFSPADAMAGMDVTAAMVQGAALVVVDLRLDPPATDADLVPAEMAAALPADRFPYLLEAIASGSLYDIAAQFEVGLDTLVRGFEARLEDVRGNGSRHVAAPRAPREEPVAGRPIA
jgi:TetR/AcrR family transcriptional regulator, tetracycline repressor protein